MAAIYQIRALIAWLRCVAAYGARDPVAVSDIRHLEARTPDAARQLDAELRLAADEKENETFGDCQPDAILRPTGARFGYDIPPPRNVCAEMPALYALQLDAFLALNPALPRLLRLIAARALAYGRLNGATHLHAYKEYLGGRKRWVWVHGDPAVPCISLYGEPSDEDCPLFIPFEQWHSVTPEMPLSPAPLFQWQEHLLVQVLKMTTNVRTLACKLENLAHHAVRDALPRLEMLVSYGFNESEDFVAEGPLTRVREYVCAQNFINLAEWHRMTRRECVLGNVEQLTICYADAYVHVDRSMLDTLTPEHVDESLLRKSTSSGLLAEEHCPLVHAFGFVPTLTEYANPAFDVFGVPFRSVCDCLPDVMLIFAWLRGAAPRHVA